MHRLSIRRTLRKLLSPERIRVVARDTGSFRRLRKVDPFALVWTLMLGSMSGRDVRRRGYRGKRHKTRSFFRAVGVRDDERRDYHVYLINVPAEKLEPRDVAATYALRWEVELLFRELKTHYRLAQLPSRKTHVVEVLIKASLLCVAASRALLRRLQRILGERFADRVPHQRWAAIVATCAKDFLLCVVRKRACSSDEDHLQRMLLHEAVDPNKRTRLLHAVEAGTHRYGPRRFHPGHRNSPPRAA